MHEISTLITAIGDFFTKSDWSQMVRLPFWSLLFTVAAGGVYCARFGKNTLIGRSISGTLSLIVLYMTVSLGCVYLPPVRTLFTGLPFLTITDTAATLVNPWTMPLGTLPPLMLRLMILVFLVDLADMFISGGKSLLTWLFSQFLGAVFALLLYTIITAGVSLIFPALLNRYAIIPVALIIGFGFLMFCAKVIFTTFVKGGNHYYSAFHKFFTVNRAGSLLTISALTFLASMCLMIWLTFSGHSRLEYAAFNQAGYCIILFLCLAALYIFSMLFNDKKKG